MYSSPSIIEKLAVARVVQFFSDSAKINPFINSGDKEPLWDGFFYLYNNEKQSNADLLGRVACQVKGKKVSNESEVDAYYVKSENLRNYLRDGGVLFFLVHLGDVPHKIFWAKLTPIELCQYLKKAEDQKGIKILLESIQDLKSSVAEVFEFYQDCQHQKRPSLDILTLQRLGSRFQVTFRVEGGENPLLALTKGYHYLYAIDEKGEILNPLGESQYSLQISKKAFTGFSIGDQYFDFPVNFVIKGGELRFEILHFLRIEIQKSCDSVKLVYSTESLQGIREREKALSVLLAMDSSDQIRLPKLSISCSEFRLEEDKRQRILEEVQHIRKIVSLLDELHIPSDIDYYALSKNDRNKLAMLYGAILENRVVYPSSVINDAQLVMEKIGPINILLFLSKEEDGYHAYNFFSIDEQFSIFDETESTNHLICRFSALEKEDYVRADNIDWSTIPSEYQKLDTNDSFMMQVTNADVLKILSAYDETLRPEILDAAIRLTRWMSEATTASERVIYRVNYFQSLKRKRKLSVEETNEIISFADDSGASNELRFCAAVLLDDQTRASHYFQSFSQETQDHFRTLPIWRFAKFEIDNIMN